MRIAHFCGADAANYGDQLFPLIFERRLEPHAEVIHVSPTGIAPPWTDAASSISFESLRQSAVTLDAIVIGGGNLIYTGATPVLRYEDGDFGANLAYPSLWLGAAELATELGVPLVWNATGVRRAFSPVGADLVTFAASVSEIIAVRDVSSRDYLRAAGVNSPIECVVDSGIGVGSLWPRTAIDKAYRALFLRKGKEVPPRTVVLHVKQRYVAEPMAMLACRLDRIAKSLDATPILLALGPCHGDDVLQQKLAAQMNSGPISVGKDAQLIDLAACIANANIFLGSSLHGAITACAFNTHAIVVAAEMPGAYKKFSGFLRHVGDPVRLCRTWSELEEQLYWNSQLERAPWPNRAIALAASDAYWERLIKKCSTPLPSTRCRERRIELAHLRERIGSIHKRFGVIAGAFVDQANDAARLVRERSDRVLRDQPSVDVVVCVHDALEHVRDCFESLLRTTEIDFQVIVINDGSNAETTDYLRQFCRVHQRWTVRENIAPLGYTVAANQGLSASTSDYVVLLNSDTIVSSRWLSKMIACGESSPKIGMVGPISNAASWQSVPAVHAANGDWMINKLPNGIGVDSMAAIVDALSANLNPQVPMLNGFCLAIKRSVLKSIGYFDCEISPYGYAEEIDFCFRASDAGFTMVVADTAFVYHEKSKSYGNKLRLALALAGKHRIHARYGKDRLDAARTTLSNNEALATLRGRLEAVFIALQAP